MIEKKKQPIKKYVVGISLYNEVQEYYEIFIPKKNPFRIDARRFEIGFVKIANIGINDNNKIFVQHIKNSKPISIKDMVYKIDKLTCIKAVMTYFDKYGNGACDAMQANAFWFSIIDIATSENDIMSAALRATNDTISINSPELPNYICNEFIKILEVLIKQNQEEEVAEQVTQSV